MVKTMKQLFCTLAFIAVAFASFGAFAQESKPDCNIDPDWKQSKINEVLDSCKNKAQSATPEVVAENVSAYAEVAKGVAEAIGIAAREVGVAVDDFIKTDAGKMTVALVVWHVAGDDIIGIVFGVPLVLFGAWFMFRMQDRARRTGDYRTVKGRWGEKEVPTHKSISEMSEGEGWYLAVMTIMSAVIIVTGIANIF